MLESIYEATLCHELSLRSLEFRRQVVLPIEYKGVRIKPSLRIDLQVARRLVVGLRVGLLINFNVEVLITVVRRVVNG